MALFMIETRYNTTEHFHRCHYCSFFSITLIFFAFCPHLCTNYDSLKPFLYLHLLLFLFLLISYTLLAVMDSY